MNILKKIFSIKNDNIRKVITILGIKIKIKKDDKSMIFDKLGVIDKINEINKKGVIQYYRDKGAKIGNNCRFIVHPNPWDIPDFGSEPYFIEIGNDTCISFGCTFLTHDAGVHLAEKLYNLDKQIAKLGKIKIGNNCFIGCKCTILPNIIIGDNCVIGSNSVITKSIPDGEVWAGNPAKFISKTEDYLIKNMQLFNNTEQQELYRQMLRSRK